MSNTPMQQIADTSIYLTYLVNYIITYGIAMSGSIVREIYMYKKDNVRISIIRAIVSSSICSVAMIAVSQYTTMHFSLYVFLTFIFGLFGYNIIDVLLNAKYLALMMKNIMKELGNPVLKGVSNGIDEIKKEMKEDKKDEDTKDKDNSKKEESAPKEDKDIKENPFEEFTKEELLEQIRKLEAMQKEKETK